MALSLPQPTSRSSQIANFLQKSICLQGRARQITHMIANWCASDVPPMSVVEDKGLKEIFAYVEPGYCVPSGTHIIQGVSQYIAVTILLHNNCWSLNYCSNFCCHDSHDRALKVVLQRLHALLQKIAWAQLTHYNVESTSIVVCRSTMLLCGPAFCTKIHLY